MLVLNVMEALTSLRVSQASRSWGGQTRQTNLGGQCWYFCWNYDVIFIFDKSVITMNAYCALIQHYSMIEKALDLKRKIE